MTSPIERIDGATLTNVSELVITDLSANYIKYVIEFNGLKSNTLAATNLVCRLSADNGSTWIQTDTSYGNLVQKAGGAGGTIARNIGSWNWSYLVQSISNTAGNFCSGSIEIFDPMDSGSQTKILCRSGGRIGTLGVGVQGAEVRRTGAEANNAIRIFSDSDSLEPGNFSMRYVLYGYLA